MLFSSSGHEGKQGVWGDPSNTGPRVSSMEHSNCCLWKTESSVTSTLPEPSILSLTPDVRKFGDGSSTFQAAEVDEMVSWLQYPLEIQLETEYYDAPKGHPGCSAFVLEDAVSGHRCSGFKQEGLGLGQTKQMAEQKAADVDARLELDTEARRQTFEAPKTFLSRVWSVQPNDPSSAIVQGTQNALASGNDSARHLSFSETEMSETPGVANSTGPCSVLNFPHFSRPAAVVKANLHSLGVSAVPTAQSCRGQNVMDTASRLVPPMLASSKCRSTYVGFRPDQALLREAPTVLMSSTKEPNLHLQQSGEGVERSSTTESCLTCADADQLQLSTRSFETSEVAFCSVGSGVSIGLGAKLTRNNMKSKLAGEDTQCPGNVSSRHFRHSRRPVLF